MYEAAIQEIKLPDPLLHLPPVKTCSILNLKNRV